ncbi:MAG TPA: hypothetical protein VLX28_10730 [Thermoanaerobaculia bacterium]|nr:hypothetical protein [Thermoanaerobaculia bacterium]
MGNPVPDKNFLLELGKAIGLLDESGLLQPQWLLDPIGTSENLNQRREHLLNALAGLLGDASWATTQATITAASGRWTQRCCRWLSRAAPTVASRGTAPASCPSPTHM